MLHNDLQVDSSVYKWHITSVIIMVYLQPKSTRNSFPSAQPKIKMTSIYNFIMLHYVLDIFAAGTHGPPISLTMLDIVMHLSVDAQ